MKLTHENVQSAGVVLSLLLAGTSLAMQIVPKPESLSLESGAPVWVNEPMMPRRTAPLPQGNSTLVGPVYWRLNITNRSEKTISLTSATALIRDSKWGTYGVSNAFDGVFLEDRTTDALPLNIPAFETRSVIVKGALPGWLSLDSQARCARPNITLYEYNRCSMETGTDIFGNKLEVYRDGDRFLGAAWPADIYQPELVVTFVSGSGKNYSSALTLIPLAGL